MQVMNDPPHSLYPIAAAKGESESEAEMTDMDKDGERRKLDAVIVRIMKSKQTMAHKDLVDEVIVF